ncbi:MAG: DNA-3-methyladenine glycosylase [Candidatus Saccharibacteria bacterium]|nr:DNA-3-methyladenine glycosylase [Candidatus Saccharibacteria bacterium]
MNKTLANFLSKPASIVAPLLLGSILEREVDGKLLRVKIVETEAYDQTDAASHSYKGKTPRTDIMFGEQGHLYVYFTYGMHYCCNVVTDVDGIGSAVLIRAVEPLEGTKYMQELRNHSGRDLTNGPAKLCQALAIDKQLNGHDLSTSPLKLIIQEPINPRKITQTKRIGISQAKDVPWRYYITGNEYVSRP